MAIIRIAGQTYNYSQNTPEGQELTKQIGAAAGTILRNTQAKSDFDQALRQTFDQRQLARSVGLSGEQAKILYPEPSAPTLAPIVLPTTNNQGIKAASKSPGNIIQNTQDPIEYNVPISPGGELAGPSSGDPAQDAVSKIVDTIKTASGIITVGKVGSQLLNSGGSIIATGGSMPITIGSALAAIGGAGAIGGFAANEIIDALTGQSTIFGGSSKSDGYMNDTVVGSGRNYLILKDNQTGRMKLVKKLSNSRRRVRYVYMKSRRR